MKKIKVILLLLQMIFSMVILTSCLHSVSLNERALVQALGIDFDNDEIKLTFQIFSPTTGGNMNIGASAENAKIIESSGKTVSEAMQNATLIQGKQLFIGHMRIIIIGKSLAQHDVKQALNYFNSSADSRQNVSIAVAKDKASDIMNAKINQGILPAETLEKILMNTKENGMLVDVKLFEFMGELENMQQGAILPMIGIMEQDEKSEEQQSKKQDGEKTSKSESIEKVSSVKISGIAVFANNKLVCELNDEESRGLLWIRNKINHTMIITKTDKYDLAVAEIYHSSSKLIPEITADKIAFKLEVRAQATLGEASVKEGEEPSADHIAEIEKACNEVITNECMQAFETAIIANKADVFDFGDIVWSKNSEVWKALKDNWSENASKIELTIDSKVNINRVGLEVKINK